MMIDIKKLHNEILVIVKEFLDSIETAGNHNHFREKTDKTYSAVARDVGFSSLYEEIDNFYVVKEELFLEGCIRVFLINPIMKKLLDSHSIQNEWMFDNTFGNYTISNRECEIGNYIQFIAVLNGEKVGVRYTDPFYSTSELAIMERDTNYLFGKKQIPGFKKLSPVDSVITLDWSGVLQQARFPGKARGSRVVSVEEFFKTYFSTEECNMVLTESKKAIKKAKEIIALRAIPQLLPNNTYSFKQVVIDEFSDGKMASREYEFADGTTKGFLDDDDKQIIKIRFSSFCNSIIGNKEFAKSYITAEYLYKSIKDGLSIDYTSVVVGYLKSVEQLLYLYYLSAFDGSSKLNYWDKCSKKNDKFDPEQPKYRYDPYDDIKKGEKRNRQVQYNHEKRTGNNALEIGGLILFLRYYEKSWAISEAGKEYICVCLNDYRQYCRNSYFHKDNIDSNQYETVTRIRNNTQICLYYLLGAFKLLDSNIDDKEQLGILDNRLEKLYYLTKTVKRHVYKARLIDNSEVILYYKRDLADIKFNESGELVDGAFRFIIINTDEKQLSLRYIEDLLNNDDYVKKFTVRNSSAYVD